MSFITGTHIGRRTMLRGLGATVALPFLDAMVPAGRAFAKTAAAAALDRPRLVCIEMVHGAAGASPWGAEQHLWAPVAAGREFDLGPTSLSPLESWRKYLTIVSDTDVKNAEAFSQPEIGGDHFRSSAVFLTQAHPKQTESSDVRAASRSTSSTRRSTGRTRRCPRCSCASRTSTRRAAAPTATRASTPT